MSSSNKRYTVIVIVIILLDSITINDTQIALNELSKIGVIKAKNYKLKVRGTPTNQYMVIKLLPNLSNISDCGDSSLTEYKGMLKRILNPIVQSINQVKGAVNTRTSGFRFWGAVIGGVALGVATAAQITAGIALHNSKRNAQAILQMKESIKKTNQAIEKLQDSVAGTVIAISGLQDQINTQIVPFINQLGCDAIKTRLSLRLNQYFSELSLVFGPNLRNPATTTLSIQAISRAFNDDFESLLSTLGYKSEDLLDVLESKSIIGRIIDVSLEEFFIILQIEYPTFTEVLGAYVQQFNLISYNHKGSEWMSVFPDEILVRGSFLSNINTKSCAQTTNSIICPHDTSSPLSSDLFDCATGNISRCARTPVINSHVPRYALADGVIFANCVPIICQCKSNQQALIQDPNASNVMISKEYCEEVYIDGLFITLGNKTLSRSIYAHNVDVGYPVAVDPIDVSNQLSSVKKDLAQSRDLISKAKNLLDRVDPGIMTTSKFIFLIVISVLFIFWFIISLIWLVAITKKLKTVEYTSRNQRKYDTVNSLSSLIPT